MSWFWGPLSAGVVTAIPDPDLFLRPVSTQSAGGWRTNAGGSDLHTAIDETVADDNDYIRSEDNPIDDEAVVELAAGSVDASQPVAVKYRYRKEGAGAISLGVRLLSPLATQRASAVHNGISASFVDGVLELTEAEALATDWSDAYLAFSATVGAEPDFTFVSRSPGNVRAWQGFATDGTHYYVCSDWAVDGSQQWILLKYNKDWQLVASRNMGADGDAAHTQINGVYYHAATDKLYISSNNYNTTPARGWVFVVSPAALTVDTYHDLGAKWTEAVFPWDGSWWSVNASAHEIRQFDAAFASVADHALPGTDPGGLYWSSIIRLNDVFWLNHHDDVASSFRAFEWNGSGFTEVAHSLSPPTAACTQGVFYDEENDWTYWAERIGPYPTLLAHAVKATAWDTLILHGDPVLKGRENAAFQSFTIAAFGGTAPYTYSVASGSLPAGLSLHSTTGVVSGTPTTAGTSSNIVLRVTDDDAATYDLAPFSIDIAAELTGWEEIGRQETISDGALTVSGLNLAGLAMVKLLAVGVTTGTDNADVRLRLLGGGVEIIGFYQHGNETITTSGARVVHSSAEADHILLSGNTAAWGLDDAATASFSLEAMFDEITSRALYKKIGWKSGVASNTGNHFRARGSAVLEAMGDVDGFKVYGSAALTGGKIIVLGLQ